MDGFQSSVSLVTHTTFKTGGVAEYYATATSISQLTSLLATAAMHQQPVTILGGGSNVLVDDAGIPGCVIEIAITGWDSQDVGDGTVVVVVGAGVGWDEFVAATVAAGWWGLENLSHIPGRVGATPIQNVGAYGVEVADCITAVTAINQHTGERRTFRAHECAFGYRDSFFKTPDGRQWVIIAVTFTLTTSPTPILHYRDLAERFTTASAPTQTEIREAIIAIRAKKFPDWQQVGTAGSFFKNPTITVDHFNALQARYPELPGYSQPDGQVKVPLGWILEHVCHLRGHQAGAVASYEGQALVLVNTGGATSAEVTAFASSVAAAVLEATNITISWEVTRLPYEPIP
jgi:UDP-N-acetylmuramate dehydrogenase